MGVRPLDPLLGLRLWTPLGDFRPPGYLPLCVNQPLPQVTEPLRPLGPATEKPDVYVRSLANFDGLYLQNGGSPQIWA